MDTKINWQLIFISNSVPSDPI